MIPFADDFQYTYYTASALGIRVHQTIKRSLTTCQIIQFLVGSTMAAMHLFVSYSVPVTVAYQVAEKIASTTAQVAESVTSPAAVATSTGLAVAFLKKLVYRAAGEEGLAENIPGAGNVAHVPQGIVEQASVGQDSTLKTVYRTEYHPVPCVDTSGQAFAVYLNVIYLAPLTFLFVRFFWKSYISRSSPNAKRQTKKNLVAKSAGDAMHGVERELESLTNAPEDGEAVGVGRRPSSKRVESMSPAEIAAEVKRKAALKLEEAGDGDEATRERAKKLAKEIVAKAEQAEKQNGSARNRKSNGRA